MDHAHDIIVADERRHFCGVGNVDAFKCEAIDASKSREARFLQCGVVIVIDDVDANDALTARQQPMRHGMANEAGCACYEYRCRHFKKRPYASTQMSGHKKHTAFRPMPNALTPNGVEATLVTSTMSLRE